MGTQVRDSPQPISVLVVDDDPAALEVLKVRLGSWGYDVVTATTGPEALAVLEGRGAPKLAVVDWMMPGMSGIDVVRAVREHCEDYVYVIMLTCRGGRRDVLTALEAGADDYLPKPCCTEELELRLRAGCRVVALQDQLRLLAERDPLTGSWNRRRIRRFLSEELDRARAATEPFSVVMLDVDHFKQVNDRYGHAAGDAVLRGLCRRASDQLRPYDGWARIGGEEFLIVLPACDGPGAFAAAERVRRSIEGIPFRVPGRELNVTASAGITTVDPPRYPDDIDEVLQRADRALYAAKQAGRNRVIADPPKKAA